LDRGASTFFLEMAQTARILNRASPRSLVILDEVGGGTSTFDGLALAGAIAQQLHDRNRSFTLFATHYFELTALAGDGSNGIANVHLDAVEHGEKLVFMHAVKDGPANRSFGLQVAALAGLPRAVLGEARRTLAELEQRSRDMPATATSPAAIEQPAQMALFRSPPPALDALAAVDPDELTPKQALEALYRIKAML